MAELAPVQPLTATNKYLTIVSIPQPSAQRGWGILRRGYERRHLETETR